MHPFIIFILSFALGLMVFYLGYIISKKDSERSIIKHRQQIYSKRFVEFMGKRYNKVTGKQWYLDPVNYRSADAGRQFLDDDNNVYTVVIQSVIYRVPKVVYEMMNDCKREIEYFTEALETAPNARVLIATLPDKKQ